MRIRTRWMLFLLFCSVLPMCGALWLMFDVVKSSLTSVVRSELSSVAQRNTRQVQVFFSDASADLASWSNLHILQDVLSDDDAGGAAAELTRLAGSYPFFSLLLGLNDSGVVVASSDDRLLGASMSDSDAFAAGQDGHRFQSKVRDTAVSRSMALMVSEPIRASYDEETIIGVLVGVIDWAYVTDVLADIPVLGHPQDSDRHLILVSGATSKVLYDSLAQDGVSAQSVIDALPRAGQAIDVPLGGRDYIVASATSTGLSKFDNPNWALHVMLSADAAYAPLAEIRSRFAQAAVAFILLAAIGGLLLSRSVTAPIVALASAARRFALRDFNAPLPKVRRDEVGSLVESFASMRTAVQTNEQELERARELAEAASRAKAAFLASMSHEIRTPMNGVLGMLEIIDQTPLDDDQRQMVGTMRESGDLLLSIINDVLDYSKIEAGKLELESDEIDLLDVVESVGQLLAPKLTSSEHNLVTFVEPSVPTRVIGDSTRIRQILLNLAGNAVKFSKRGEVIIRADCRGKNAQGQLLVALSVRDQGIGISEEARSRLFKEFSQADTSTTRRFGGTGLGLAISGKLVDRMGGTIDVQSSLGEGSTFTIKVPLEATDAPAVRPSEARISGTRVGVLCAGPFEGEAVCCYLEDRQAEVRRFKDQADLLADCAATAPDVVVVLLSDEAATRAAYDALVETGFEAARIVLGQGRGRSLPLWSDHSAKWLVTRPWTRATLLTAISAASTADANMVVPVRSSPDDGAADSQAPTELDSAPAGHILFAEDNSTNQLVIGRLLTMLGFTFESALNGVEALEKWRTGEYTLLLSDCHMPEMDGFELARTVRADEQVRGGRSPIIAITASVLREEVAACHAAGMDEVVAKPVKLDALRAALEKWMPAHADSAA